MSAAKQFSQADAALKDIGAVRAQLAAVIANPKASLEAITAARRSADEAVASIAAHEEALRQIERPLIVANDEAGLAEREAKLKGFAANLTRIGVLVEELDKRHVVVQRAVANEAAKLWAAPRLKEFERLLAQLDGTKLVAQKLDDLASAALTARDLGLAISKRAELHPEVSELDIQWPTTLNDPMKEIERLARRYTTLESPKKTAAFP